MKVRVEPCGSGSVVRLGPLLFALKIKEDWRAVRKNGPITDWAVYPDSDWNMAILRGSIKVVRQPLPEQPFGPNPPVVLRAMGRRVYNWKIESSSAGSIPDPLELGEPVPVELHPYGAAKLRMTVLPVIE
jgi:hypothetical protein